MNEPVDATTILNTKLQFHQLTVDDGFNDGDSVVAISFGRLI